MSDSIKDKLIDKQAIRHLAILIGISLAIGVYLIATTVLISKDGLFYIKRAQEISSDPVGIIKSHPPGYPYLIFATHKAISFFTGNNSNQAWIYSAQIVTLLCRLLAMIPLYFMGKILVGSKNSFAALLILIFLPYPARIACEVLREWPYLLFFSTGFFFLLWSAIYKKWWAFGIAGFSCGLGYLIRPESAQLIIFGLLWAGVSLLRPGMWGLGKGKVIFAAVLLVIGFAVPGVPYIRCKNNILPDQLKYVKKAVSLNHDFGSGRGLKSPRHESDIFAAEILPGNFFDGSGEIFTSFSENLMWFFVLPLAVGFYGRFGGKCQTEEKFFMTIFILTSMTLMLLRFCYIEAHISRRWTLPLVLFTVFYIPSGIEVIGAWLKNANLRNQKAAVCENDRSYFVILLLIGICICLPKLLRPIGSDKHGYAESAKWLRENAQADAVVVVPDDRIGFYSEIENVVVKTERPDESVKWDYYVELLKGDELGAKVSYWVDRRRKKKMLVVHRY